jgi:hypothetical protein
MQFQPKLQRFGTLTERQPSHAMLPPAARRSLLRHGLGSLALLLGCAAAACLAYALLRMTTINRLPLDFQPPTALHGVAYNQSLRALRLFAGVATMLTAPSVLLAWPSLRSITGKLAMPLTLVTLAASLTLLVSTRQRAFVDEDAGAARSAPAGQP